jgi:hypothetical protein
VKRGSPRGNYEVARAGAGAARAEGRSGAPSPESAPARSAGRWGVIHAATTGKPWGQCTGCRRQEPPALARGAVGHMPGLRYKPWG